MKATIPIIALFWAIGLSVASLALPPMGVIDNSVLILLAQIIIFIASLVGVELPNIFKQFRNENQGRKKVAS